MDTATKKLLAGEFKTGDKIKVSAKDTPFRKKQKPRQRGRGLLGVRIWKTIR